jgi:hypothetical protein
LPAKRFPSLDEMLAEIEAPRPKRFRLARLVVIGAAVAAAFVTLNDHPWILKASAVATALKVEFAAASARVAGSLEAAPPVKPSLREQTPSVASALPAPELVPESAAEAAESKPPELEPAALEAAAFESAAVESAVQETAALEPAVLESEAPLQIPMQSNAEATAATSLSEASQPGEANAITPSSSGSSSAVGGIDTGRDQCIAQCERDHCDDKAREACG